MCLRYSQPLLERGAMRAFDGVHLPGPIAMRVRRFPVNLVRVLCFAGLATSGCSSDPVPPGAEADAAVEAEAGLCLPLTSMGRCAGLNCGIGSYCTDVTQGPSSSALCGFFDKDKCGSCATCSCVTVPAGCTCTETTEYGVAIDCRKK